MPSTFPILSVRVAFASASPYTDSPTWSTITHDVRYIRTIQGRFHSLDRIEAGTVNIELLNHRGQYWPKNASGDYYPNVLPAKRISVIASYPTVLTPYYLSTAFAESWTPGFLSIGGKGPIVSLAGADIIKPLSRVLLNDGTGYAQELSGTRVGNVLDDAGWNATERSIDAGQSQMQATGALANVNAMEHLYNVQDSERGLLYQHGSGYIVFQDRIYRLTNATSITPQAVFSDVAGIGEFSYHAFTSIYDDQYIYNDVRITRIGGTEQAVSDAASQSAYGLRGTATTGMLMTTDAEAMNLALDQLSQFKDPYFRIQNITILPQNDPTNLWPLALGLMVSDRITVKLSSAGIDEDYYIEAISHDIDCVNLQWRTTWELRPVNLFAHWVLDSSELDLSTRLSY